MTPEARLQRLENIEAIKRVTADYAAAVNWGAGETVDREGIRAALSEDIHWKATAMQVDARGIDAVLDVIGQPQPGITLAMHSFSNPPIDVDGDTAIGNWLLWVAIRAGDKTDQVFQSEDLTYVRTASGWRIASIDLHFGAMLNG
jgi:hypothetical protein